MLSREGELPPDWMFQGYAEHTPDQMVWVAEMVERLRFRQLAFATSAYHLPRCVLTFVKVWDARCAGYAPVIASMPLIDQDNLAGSFATVDATTSGSVAEELDRITRYQAKGDVATAEEFFAHYTRSRG